MSPRQLLGQLASAAAELGTRRIFLGVSDEVCRALASLTEARTKIAVYRRDGGEPYAIETVAVRIDDVLIEAQAHSRPATADETAGDDWRPHAEAYDSRTVR